MSFVAVIGCGNRSQRSISILGCLILILMPVPASTPKLWLWIILSSANFTEAAQQRNIEMGLLSRAAYLAEQVAAYFEGLRQSGRLQRLADA